MASHSLCLQIGIIFYEIHRFLSLFSWGNGTYLLNFHVFSQVVEQKELALAEIENKKLQEQEEAEKAAERLAQMESAKNSPQKDKWQSVLEFPDFSSMSEKMFRNQLNRSAQANV